MNKRLIAVPQKRYAHPDYLRQLSNRIEQCYFSPDRDWSCIEDIFRAEIKAMEQRTPKPAPAAPARRLSDHPSDLLLGSIHSGSRRR